MQGFGVVVALALFVGCEDSSSGSDRATTPVTPTEACQSYTQGAFICISSAFADPVAAAAARDSLDGTCSCLAGLAGAEADELVDYYQCANEVIADADCTSADGYANVGAAIADRCVRSGGALQACEDYVDVATACVLNALGNSPYTDDIIAATEAACEGSGSVVGPSRQQLVQQYECATRAFDEGDCFTPQGYAAIAEAAAQCFPLPGEMAECP